MNQSPSGDTPVVVTRSGPVRGVWNGASARFLGIPFAEPPVGELRFAAPESPEPWHEPLVATEYGPTPQRRPLAPVTTIPEPSIPGDSTLNVNVFTPDPTSAEPGEGMPVLVWIHGGGYLAGSPASPWYDGFAFNRNGVVTVTLSYRLGFDGFGVLPDAPHNRGVLDWLAGLEWVRDNIAAFGGDPARVTIAGQSAGGGAVLTLAAMPAARGLFRNAWSLSGAPADIPLERARAATRALAAKLGVPATLAGMATVSEPEILDAQGGLGEPPADLEQMLAGLSDLAAMLTFGPVVDGDLITATVPEAFSRGQGADVPLVMGTTREEFSAMLAPAATALEKMGPATVLGMMDVPPEVTERLLDALPAEGTARIAGRVITDRLFRIPLLRLVQARGQAPTWAYDFGWRSAVSGYSDHCLDIPYFFDNLADPDVDRVAGPDAPQALADEIHGAAISFITTGEPGWARSGGALQEYQRYGAGDDGYASARILADIEESR